MPFPTSLRAWLAYIEQHHPQHHIALGLDRVRAVYERLACTPSCPVFTVTGTNGKGSTSAMLAAMLRAGGYRVGLYMSPHLLRYNERVRLDGVEASDTALCEAFVAVEQARRQAPEIALTYFEFGTLAAFWLFARAGLDAWVLEVGLGGRLDAVNVVDADVAVITAVDIDHTDYLGTDRDAIGYEKAGIARYGRPVVVGDANPPAGLSEQLKALGAVTQYWGHDFGARQEISDHADAQNTKTWTYWQRAAGSSPRTENTARYPMPSLAGAHQLTNAAMAITALGHVRERLPLSPAAMAQGLQEVRLAGRLQPLSRAPFILCDVAHNPHAAQALAEYLAAQPKQGQKESAAGATDAAIGSPPRTVAVFGMLADKDIAGVIERLQATFDDWWIVPLPGPRGASLAQLHEAFAKAAVERTRLTDFDSVAMACAHAAATLNRTDRMVIFGSFLTVSEALSYYAEHPLES